MNTKEVLIKELQRSTRDFETYMREYAAQEVKVPLTVEKWNMAQLIEHVILTDQSIIGLLQIPFLKKKTGNYSKYQMRDFLLNRTKKIKNPEVLTPKSSQSKSINEWLDDFESERSQLVSMIIDEKFDLDSEEAFPHFTLGLLTRRDWLYLLCFHSDRHIAQAQEMLFCN